MLDGMVKKRGGTSRSAVSLCRRVTPPDWWPPPRRARPNCRQLAPEPAAPREESLLLERLLDRHTDFVVDERFDQIGQGPPPHGGRGPRQHVKTRDHQHDHLRTPLVDHSQQHPGAGPGQAGKHQVVARVRQQRAGLRGVRGRASGPSDRTRDSTAPGPSKEPIR